jgi:hypothetical protein
MKRSPALQPLSRDHHAALKLAKACERSTEAGLVDETCRRVVTAFADELEPHFLIEERELLPLLSATAMQALAERTLADHARLRALVDALRQRCDADTLRDFGKRLAAHVRFEERELFPALEELL